MELSIIVAAYGISWGLFYFLGFRKKNREFSKILAVTHLEYLDSTTIQQISN